MATLFGIITAVSVAWIGGGILVYITKLLTMAGKAQEYELLNILEFMKHPIKNLKKPDEE